jgi:hypothetical protein
MFGLMAILLWVKHRANISRLAAGTESRIGMRWVTANDLLRVQKRIAEDKWRENPRATAWVGKAIAETLNLDVREPAVKKRILGMIKIWLASGALKTVEEPDENRHKKEFIVVGEWAT